MTASTHTAPTAEQTPDEHELPHSPSRRITPGAVERLASITLGGALVTLGLRRRSTAGAAMALAGGWLCYRGVRGHGGFSRAVTTTTETETGSDWAEPDTADGALEETRSITVGKPADELYEMWDEPQHLARITQPFAEVTPAREDRHRWIVRGPFGRNLEWETQTVESRPGELRRWESLEDAPVSTEGVVRFHPAPGDRGTEVTLTLSVDPPGGALGGAILKRAGFVPDLLAGKMLHRFKSLAETGEIPTLEKNPSARGAGDLL